MIGRREVVIVWCMGLDHINTSENDNFYLLDSFQVISSAYVIFKRKKVLWEPALEGTSLSRENNCKI